MRLPVPIEQALQSTGMPWEIEQGSRHRKIKVNGRMVGILPNGQLNSLHDRSLKNTISQIKKAGNGEKCSSRQM